MPLSAIHQFSSNHDFLEFASKEILATISDTLSRYETCRIGLSGGSTPKGLYKRLSELHIPWNQVTLIITDERNVTFTDEASNYGMIRDVLLSSIKIPKENILYFDTALGYDSAVLAMEQKLLQLKHERKPSEPLFDLLILGAGPDGHIAGIFPDTDTELQKGFLTAKTSTDVFEVRERMTCTMKALTSCQQALLFLKGHEKAHLLHALEKGDTSMPVGKFIHEAQAEVLFLE